MYEKIAKVYYQWGQRYWCFADNMVADVYDECGSTITHNPITARGFCDMSLDDLITMCLDRRDLVLYVGDKADELLYELCTRL